MTSDPSRNQGGTAAIHIADTAVVFKFLFKYPEGGARAAGIEFKGEQSMLDGRD